jgi:hypothetical protein
MAESEIPIMDRPYECEHSDYVGPERRKEERRTQCSLHSGLQQSYDDLKELQTIACRKIDKLSTNVDSRVPMKLFYVMIGLVVAILAFQWTTYERVNAIALSHQRSAGDMKVELQKISSTVDSNRLVNTNEISRLTRAVDRHQAQGDKENADIKNGIKELTREIQTIKDKMK